MKTASFHYHLPEELIAQHPLADRSRSRLLHIKQNELSELQFKNLPSLLRAGDCLVLNDTKVIPARLLGVKHSTGAIVEILLLQRISLKRWRALVRPGKRLKPGTQVDFLNGRLTAQVQDMLEDGERFVDFAYEGVWEAILDEAGQMPLPPYIHERLEDPDRYQTVYAKYDGSAAAPTAGLHFTRDLLAEVSALGVHVVYLTLHVGLGTFRPVKEKHAEDHPMHEEYFELSEAAASTINRCKSDGGRVIAVGTTSCRVLESVADETGLVKAAKAWTKIFIYPGYHFKCLDALITNFHLPESTLIMLVAALAGYHETMTAYRHAVKEGFRFFSFGDAMFVEKNMQPGLPD